ncbi:MAG TPA: hypothetical protein DCS82_11615 [Rhodospirillaceae bacterium]|nr:hypothetical protein [Rhodospirillaceae bacterium]HAA91409.1 hypothetical protein [Rhodospirillaceae bacterium]HAT36358.1 hypothetical protein [Rhodospirillaceae bacterium]|tara:strand:- start:130 stop:504 length:375 start_codon:yes stop_codon:yes gene_type:complete
MSDNEKAVTHSSASDKADGDGANLVYILYLVAILFGLTALVGLIMAYIKKSDAPAWVQSHYQFQIRTFWINLFFLIVGAATSVFLVGFAIIFFTLIWWIIRSVKGMQAIGRGEAHPNPTSWMFG